MGRWGYGGVFPSHSRSLAMQYPLGLAVLISCTISLTQAANAQGPWSKVPLPDDHPEAIKDRYRRQGDRNLEVFKKIRKRVQ